MAEYGILNHHPRTRNPRIRLHHLLSSHCKGFGFGDSIHFDRWECSLQVRVLWNYIWLSTETPAPDLPWECYSLLLGHMRSCVGYCKSDNDVLPSFGIYSSVILLELYEEGRERIKECTGARSIFVAFLRFRAKFAGAVEMNSSSRISLVTLRFSVWGTRYVFCAARTWEPIVVDDGRHSSLLHYGQYPLP